MVCTSVHSPEPGWGGKPQGCQEAAQNNRGFCVAYCVSLWNLVSGITQVALAHVFHVQTWCFYRDDCCDILCMCKFTFSATEETKYEFRPQTNLRGPPRLSFAELHF
ncbi:uncharacterized protein ASCRUDRAFT_130565 [Ascoidea rubescens DSM 1968]|uniref:Uncharacterized protein n=1 Tax=Ascoidea rubescens DSM 1968 TaxID=1344418 RepID=A0A1D2V8K3_9ASCO|nr:hypothetical protein ASCRUDRAFT_130565 [Ascoidea rubescens DSM 1968]ODV57938.1 hypothetical protein ASCRUDRAFT_130565 [Ascoidea rubescens DSM 1968]